MIEITLHAGTAHTMLMIIHSLSHAYRILNESDTFRFYKLCMTSCKIRLPSRGRETDEKCSEIREILLFRLTELVQQQAIFLERMRCKRLDEEEIELSGGLGYKVLVSTFHNWIVYVITVS